MDTKTKKVSEILEEEFLSYNELNKLLKNHNKYKKYKGLRNENELESFLMSHKNSKELILKLNDLLDSEPVMKSKLKYLTVFYDLKPIIGFKVFISFSISGSVFFYFDKNFSQRQLILSINKLEKFLKELKEKSGINYVN